MDYKTTKRAYYFATMCSNPIVLQRTHKREESVKNISSLQMMEFDKKKKRRNF